MAIRQRSASKFLLIGASLFLTLPGLAIADSWRQELDTAVEYAGYTAKAQEINTLHRYLRQTLNCLVGWDDAVFDAGYGNPCQGQGRGVLNDFAGTPEQRLHLQQARLLAEVGIHIRSYSPAHHVALAIAELLQESARKQD